MGVYFSMDEGECDADRGTHKEKKISVKFTSNMFLKNNTTSK